MGTDHGYLPISLLAEGKIEYAIAADIRPGPLASARRHAGEAGLEVYGGTDSPYIWFRAPGGMGSWEFFDRLLTEANVVTTPGEGFGPSGAGFIRLTAFGDAENTAEAVRRIKAII